MKPPLLRSSCDTKRGHPDAMFMLFLGFLNDMLMGSVLTTCISAFPLVQELQGDFVCKGPWPGKMLCKWGRRLLKDGGVLATLVCQYNYRLRLKDL